MRKLYVVNLNSMTDAHPYSAFEVLQNCFHEDIGGVLNNYLQMEKAEIQRAGILPNAQRMRLRGWHYYKTLSKLQQPTEATVVDFIIKGQVEGTDGNNRIELQNTAFRMRYIFDLRPCHQSSIGPLIWLNALWKDDPVFPGYWIETNEYLLPILRAKDYEHVAHDMLDSYFPENRKVIGGDTTVVEAEELAHRMGQRIEDVCFADKTIMGQIYYDYGEIDLIDDEGAVYRKRIRPGTILISKDNCSSAAVRNSTIVHECCHLYLDRWFFLLQMMAGRPYQAYSSRRKEHRRGIHRGTAIEWMEKQCEKLPAMVVIDELSSFKNYQSQRFKYLRKVRPYVRRWVGLTGTPSSNGLMDLWAEIGILDGGERLGKFIGRYREAYFKAGSMNPSTGVVFQYVPRPGAEEMIYQRISDITISMKALDYLNMPDCIPTRYEVEMNTAERELYDMLKQDLLIPLRWS